MRRNVEMVRGEQDGLVADAVRTALVLGVWGWELVAEKARRLFGTAEEAQALVPSPPVPAAPVLGEPKTLREIGLDGALARDFEMAFRIMGAVKGDRIVGYRFRTPSGVVHALRLGSEEEAVRSGLERAA
jgi:hypothetical protein